MSNNKQQTAVEWLVEQFEKYYVFRDLKNTIVYQQAKEIEKEQIIDAYKFGIQDEYVIGSEQYYNEIYTHSINTAK
jgi:hypothetical protein